MKKLFLIGLLLVPYSISADEINMMTTIDGESNGIQVENFYFERKELTDSTSILISANEAKNVKCAIYDKNDKPIKVSTGKVTPPFSEVLVLSRNAMIIKAEEPICLLTEPLLEKARKALEEVYKESEEEKAEKLAAIRL